MAVEAACPGDGKRAQGARDVRTFRGNGMAFSPQIDPHQKAPGSDTGSEGITVCSCTQGPGSRAFFKRSLAGQHRSDTIGPGELCTQKRCAVCPVPPGGRPEPLHGYVRPLIPALGHPKREARVGWREK